MLDDAPAGFNIEGFFTTHELKFRVADTDLFLGGRYEFLGADVSFDNRAQILDDADARFDERTAGLTALLEVDERDNIFSPTSGPDTKLELGWWSNVFGGDTDYWRTRLRSTSYWDLVEDLNLGVKVDAEATGGDVPFYHLPFIRLRGIGSLRYQDDAVVSTEGELRYDLTARWSLIGFGGVGVTMGADPSGYVKGAGGGGFRYLLARRLGLKAGLDIARGARGHGGLRHGRQRLGEVRGAMGIDLTSIAHVGIRVHDLERARSFYEILGFEFVVGPVGPEPVAILSHPAGIEINLILNAAAADAENVLMDVPVKHPGYTHVALAVSDLEATMAALEAAGVAITEGPVTFPGGTRAIFVRDPDKNVVELDELA